MLKTYYRSPILLFSFPSSLVVSNLLGYQVQRQEQEELSTGLFVKCYAALQLPFTILIKSPKLFLMPCENNAWDQISKDRD